MDGEFYTHLHMSAGNDKGEVFGGHLNRAVVSATCEMVIHVIDGSVDRTFDEETGLNVSVLRCFSGLRRGESGGAQPRRFRFRWNVPHAALFAHALFCCRQNAFFSCPSGGPISFRSEREHGGKNAAKNQWFLDFLLGRF